MTDGQNSAREIVRRAIPIMEKIEKKQDRIYELDQKILTEQTPAKAEERKEKKATRVMVITMLAVTAAFIAALYFAMLNETFADEFNKIVFQHPRMYFTLLLLIMLVVSAFFGHLAENAVLRAPSVNKEELESMQEEKEKLEEELQKLVSENKKLLQQIPSKYRSRAHLARMAAYLQKNPGATLQEAGESAGKKSGR